ncbi:hypothetical protein Tco_1077868, partial [Tanacetum coccineum]
YPTQESTIHASLDSIEHHFLIDGVASANRKRGLICVFGIAGVDLRVVFCNGCKPLLLAVASNMRHMTNSNHYGQLILRCLMRLLDFMKEKKQKLFGFAQIDFVQPNPLDGDHTSSQLRNLKSKQFNTQPVQQPPYEPTLTDQTSYIARIVPDTVLSDRCEKFSRQPGSVESTVGKGGSDYPWGGLGCRVKGGELTRELVLGFWDSKMAGKNVMKKDGSADSDGNSNYVIEPLQLLETIVQELYARGGSRRRKVGVSDLNEPLPVENLEHLAVVALSVGSRIPVVHDGPGQEPVGSAQPVLIDLDDFNDDVVLSFHRAFEEQKLPFGNFILWMREGKLVLVDDDEKLLENVDYLYNSGCDDELQPVDDEIASFLASKPMGFGYGPESLLEQWRKNEVDEDYKPYDDDMYEGQKKF